MSAFDVDSSGNAEEVNERVNPKVIALPMTVENMLAGRVNPKSVTLIDQVERIHIALWKDDQYRRLLDGVFPGDFVEGTEVCDDVEAARMIRDYAREYDDAYTAGKTLAAIRSALRRVLIRFNLSRKQRRTFSPEQARV